MAGGDASTTAARPIDGIDLTKILTGDKSETKKRPWFSCHGQSREEAEHLAVIEGGWKLKVNGPRLTNVDQLQNGSRMVGLFEISNDPFEKNELRDRHPDKVAKLGARLVAHRALQPRDSVPKYGVGKAGFVPPKNWQLDPHFPNKLVGKSKQ